jgi:trehalose 6-phosphate synthase/phosphatase
MPNENVINLLNFLLDDPKNIVYIVSGKAKINLETWFKSIPKLGLAPEYGLIYKECRNEENTYKKIKEIKNMTWKDAALKIVSDFTKKTEGSRLENKENSIVWNFKDCDPYFGRVTSNILERYLSNIFLNNEIEIVSGRDYIEIKPINDNKGYFIHYILNEEIKKGNVPDLILAIGDDTSDEEMFKFLNYVNREQMRVNLNMKIYTTTMGKKPSTANFYITEPGEFVEYLEMMYHHN